MKYTKIIIKNNPDAEKDGKRAIAEITKEDGKVKIVRFGLHNSGGTFFDGATEEKKKNYNNRHGKMKEKWGEDGVCTAGFIAVGCFGRVEANQLLRKLSKKSLE